MQSSRHEDQRCWEVFAELVRDHEWLIALICRDDKRVDDDEGMKHEVLLKIWEGLQEGREVPKHPLAVRAWLRTITNHAIIDHFRSRSRDDERCVWSGLAFRPTDYDTADDPAVACTEKELRHIRIVAVRIAVRELDPLMKKVVKWRYYKGCKTSEIAKRLGISIKTVRRLRAKAIEVLREKLKGVAESIVS